MYSYHLSLARVAELVDALASGASDRKIVGVQVPPRAQNFFGVSPVGGAPNLCIGVLPWVWGMRHLATLEFGSGARV